MQATVVYTNKEPFREKKSENDAVKYSSLMGFLLPTASVAVKSKKDQHRNSLTTSERTKKDSKVLLLLLLPSCCQCMCNHHQRVASCLNQQMSPGIFFHHLHCMPSRASLCLTLLARIESTYNTKRKKRPMAVFF
jgi:hypothetical protein